MSTTRVLRRHRLDHIPDLTIDDDILRVRYARGCSMSQCSGRCCRSGVLAGSEERDKVVRHAERVRRYMDESQEHDPALWFGEELADADFASGHAVRTQVHRGTCVFLDRDARCVLQKVETEDGADIGALKPFYCRAYPVSIEHAVLVVDSEHCPDETQCCGPVAVGSLSLFDVCAFELEFLLGAEGLAELRELAGTE